MKRFAVVLLLAVFMLPAAAAADSPEERAVRISKNVMSPFCPGSTLHDCPSDTAIEMRLEIQGWAEDGMTDEQIYSRLEREWGPGIRAVPQDDASILVWVVPGLVLAAGSVLAYIVSRRWSRDETRLKSTGGLDSPTADDRRRLEAELSRFQERLWGAPMIPTLVIIVLGLAALAYVLRPLGRGPVRDEAETPQLIQEAEERKESALLALIDIEEEKAVGKLSDGDFDSLRSQYEIEALRALRELDELGAESGSEDDAVEAEIARIRARLDDPPANGT